MDPCEREKFWKCHIYKEKKVPIPINRNEFDSLGQSLVEAFSRVKWHLEIATKCVKFENWILLHQVLTFGLFFVDCLCSLLQDGQPDANHQAATFTKKNCDFNARSLQILLWSSSASTPPTRDESLPCRSVSSGSRLCRESPAQQLWSATKGKKQCDSYFRQGRGGGVRDVMLGSRFGPAEKPCASAHTGVWWMTPAATAGLVVTQANGNSKQLAAWGSIGRRESHGSAFGGGA